jgi:hypothetical protein
MLTRAQGRDSSPARTSAARKCTYDIEPAGRFDNVRIDIADLGLEVGDIVRIERKLPPYRRADTGADAGAVDALDRHAPSAHQSRARPATSS